MSSSVRPEYIIGAIWEPSLAVVDGNGAAVNLSAYTVRWALKATRGGADYAGTGMPITGAGTSGGILSATVPTTTTEAVAAGTYWEEFEWEISGASPRLGKAQRQVVVVERVIVPDPDEGGGDTPPI